MKITDTYVYVKPNIYLRGAVYYLRKQIKGKVKTLSLGASKTKAFARAKRLLKEIEAERFEVLEQTKQIRGFCSLGQVLDAFDRAAAHRRVTDGRPSANTVRDYRAQLLNVVRSATGAKGKIEDLSSDVLTRELVRNYTDAEVAKGNVDDTEWLQRRSRTIRSTLRQARGVFSFWALDAYIDMDIKLPDLSGFLKASSIKEKKRKYQLPPQDLIDKTIKAGRELKDTNADLYSVFLLCYDCGLRAGEAVEARTDWIQKRSGRYEMLISAGGEWKGPKSGQSRVLPIHESIAKALLDGRPPGGYLVDGLNPTARCNLIRRDFAVWMRGLGWDKETYKGAAHELRKLIGSEWITMYPNPVVCQKWLGHADLKTTMDYYADLLEMPDRALPKGM